MTQELIHCPYCNAAVPLVEMDLTQARLRCPRCGDSFPNRQRQNSTGGPALATAEPVVPPSRLSNAALARIVLGIMLGSAAVALTFALTTIDFRRTNDHKAASLQPPSTAPTQTSPPAAPEELTGLGLLPADCNLVAGLNVVGLLEQPEGRELLKPAPDGVPGLAQLSAWSGLKVDEFEHLVVGARVADQLPRVFLIAQTRQPYDPKVIAKKLAPTVADKHQGRPVYRLKLTGPFSGLLWLHSERTLIVAVNFLGSELKDLDAIPSMPRRSTEGLPTSIKSGLEKRLPKDAFVWVVGDLTPAVALREGLETLVKLPPEPKDLLKRVSGFTLGLRVQKGLTLLGVVEANKVEDVPVLVGFLQKQKLEGMKSLTVESPPPQADPTEPGSDRRLTLQARFTMESLRKALK